ncbi:MAG: hypothetical protein WAO55_11650 [Candidatus Manganitrophaceae bacterium]
MKAGDEVCKTLLDRVEQSVACGILDLRESAYFGSAQEAGSRVVLNETVAAVLGRLIDGPDLGEAERKAHVAFEIPQKDRRNFLEIHFAFDSLLYFVKVIKEGKAALILVAGEEANIGMCWSQLKLAVPAVEEILPSL